MQTFFWMILSGSTDLTWPKIGGGQSCFFQLNFKGKTFNSWKSGPTDDFCHLQFYLNGGSEVSNRGKCVGLGTGIPGHLMVTITAIGSFRSMAKLEFFFQKNNRNPWNSLRTFVGVFCSCCFFLLNLPLRWFVLKLKKPMLLVVRCAWLCHRKCQFWPGTHVRSSHCGGRKSSFRCGEMFAGCRLRWKGGSKKKHGCWCWFMGGL